MQLTKDGTGGSSGDEHGADEGEGIARASSEILAARKRVSVKRGAAAGAGPAPKASNPFAGISLTAPTATTTTTRTPAAAAATTTTPPAPFGASLPAATGAAEPETKPTTTTSGGFGGLAKSGSGFGGFGSLSTANGGTSGFGGLAFGASAPLAFGEGSHDKRDALADASDKSASKTDPSPSVFGAQTSVKNEQPAEAQQTGEEGEETVHSYPASLFEFVEDKENGRREWRTRGSGEFKLNKDKETGQRGRLIMRQRGIGKLLLNANVYKNMTVSVMAEQKRMSMFAVKLGKDAKEQAAVLVASIKEFV
jgi:hypothetical protein